MDVQRLIGEVARRQNVLLDRSDPIFIAVMLNEILLAEHVQRLEAALGRANQSIAATSKREMENARQVASRFIAEAARYSSDQVRAAGAELRIELGRIVADSVAAANDAADRATRTQEASQWSAVAAMAGACVAVVTAAAAWLHLR